MPFDVQKRPFSDSYETKENLDAEEMVASRISKMSGLLPVKLPKRDVLDFAMTRDDVVECYLEVRTRSISSTTIEDFFLPLKKFTHIRTTFDSSKLKTSLVVVFSDRILRVWLGPEEVFPVEFWGCSRGDKEYDREPCCAIPLSRFKELEEVS